MAYQPISWTDGYGPPFISAANLDRMEQGILDANNPSAGSSLPASPTDGQTFIFQVDPANNIFWQLRYRAAISAWEFIGGTPNYGNDNATYSGITSTTYVNASGTPLTVSVPLVGDYLLSFGATIDNDNYTAFGQGSHAHYMSVSSSLVESQQTLDNIAILSMADRYVSLQRTVRRNGLSANSLVTMKHRVASSQSGFSNTGSALSRWITLIPMRVFA